MPRKTIGLQLTIFGTWDKVEIAASSSPRPDGSPRVKASRMERRCADCVHLRVLEYSRRYFKCALTDTADSATDIGKNDRACKQFRGRG